jgi:hypothetical protein
MNILFFVLINEYPFFEEILNIAITISGPAKFGWELSSIGYTILFFEGTNLIDVLF